MYHENANTNSMALKEQSIWSHQDRKGVSTFVLPSLGLVVCLAFSVKIYLVNKTREERIFIFMHFFIDSEISSLML